jgi:hypothetical protein
MAIVESMSGGLPATLDGNARHRFARSLYVRQAPKAAFLSQLIAEKHQMSIQREKRQAPIAEVLNVYDAAGRVAQKRLPPGTRTDIQT